jgi:hypothetical protein
MSVEEIGWPTILTLGITLVFSLFLAFGATQLAASNFPLTILGIGTLVLAIRQRRHWWLLLCLPIITWPFLFLTVLMSVCLTTGNCL